MNSLQSRIKQEQEQTIARLDFETIAISDIDDSLYDSIIQAVTVSNEDGTFLDSDFEGYFTDKYFVLEGFAIIRKGYSYHLLKTSNAISVAVNKKGYYYNFQTNSFNNGDVVGIFIDNGIYIGEKE